MLPKTVLRPIMIVVIILVIIGMVITLMPGTFF